MKQFKRKKSRWKEYSVNALAAGIPLIGFLLFGIIPLVMAGVVSLNELHTTDLGDMKFIGLQNFVTILTNGDNATYASYFSTLIFTINVPICIAVALFIANLVNRTKFGQRLFRSVFFIPYVCSTVVIALAFKTLFREQGGVFNAVLNVLGLKGVGWLVDSPWMFMLSTTIMTVWSGLGLCIVLFQAALAKVDASYYEAAKIDGASSTQIFWKITWPAISPTTAYLITMKLIWSLQAMTETYILAEKGTFVPTWPNSAGWVSDTVVTHIYNMMMSASYAYGYGLAAAAGWILAIIVLIITRVNMKLQERWVVYDF